MTKDPTTPRSASRFAAGLSGVLHLEGRAYPCSAQNLSRTGVLLEGRIPMPEAHEVELTLESSGGDLKVDLVGRVVRRQRDPQGEHHRIGVEFSSVTDAERQTLEALVHRVVEGFDPAPLATLPPGAGPAEIRTEIEKVPLPHRMALATRGSVKEREILIHDPSPLVLDALARNPSITLPEIRSLLRLRGLIAQTLEVLARETKWMGNAELKNLLLAHPQTPFKLAERLVDGMPPEAIRRLIQMPGLNPTLRLQLGKRFGPGSKHR